MTPVRSLVLLFIGFLLAACGGSPGTNPVEEGAQARVAPSSRPNVLLIMVDDLGYNDLAINNDNTSIHTPNLDQLAQNGVRFTRHYAGAVCSTARAALLTSQYPERIGYLPNGRGISPEIITMPEQLQKAGYTTWHIGKWHVGDLQRTAWPDHQGFDHWFGFLNQWRLAGLHKKGQIKLTRPRYENPWLEGDSLAGRHYEGHLENILTDKAIEVVTELNQAEEPWFLNLWFYAPHTPVSPAAEFATLYPDSKEGRYRALVHQLDSNIGRLLERLDTLGVRDNTIVVVVSDNGATGRDVDSNAPFYGRKTTVFEGGLRTPLIIEWPDDEISAQVFTQTISSMDIFPTLLESLAIETTTDIDGISFYKSLLAQESAPSRDLFWEHGWSFSVLSADSRWRLVSPQMFPGERPTLKLYDLEADFTGTRELLPSPEAKVRQLLERYRFWSEEVHRVNTRFVGDDSGNGLLTGMSFLRTPGFGGYTFAIGLSQDRQGQVAAQRDIWNLGRSGDTITAQYGKMRLSGEIKTPRHCHSVVVSGIFYRHTSAFAGPEKVNLTMYIDGEKVQSTESKNPLVVRDPTEVTVIGDPNASTNTGVIYPPLILNIPIDTFPEWTAASVDQRVCGRS